jgi:uncharacterized membrane protein
MGSVPADARPLAADRLAVRAVIAADRRIYGLARHWLLVANALALPFALLPVIAPLLRAAGQEAVAGPIYAFFSHLCHQRDDRSFHVYGEQMACCQRCFAIYGGLFALGLLYVYLRASVPDLRPLRPLWAAVLCAPLILDVMIQVGSDWDGSPLVRIGTGLLFATAISWLALPFLERGFAQIRRDLEHTFARLVAQGRARPLSGATAATKPSGD